MNKLLLILAIATLFLSAPLLAQGPPPPGQTGGDEGLIAALEEAVDELEASVAAQQGEIIALETSVAAQQGEIIALETSVAAQQDEIIALETSVAAQQDEIIALETSLAENVPFSGAYFVRNDAGDPGTASVMTLHSDGTITNTASNMFCIREPDCGGLTPPQQAIWKKTADNKVSVVWFQFGINDLEGGDFTYDDLPKSSGTILKLTWVQTFDDPIDGVFQRFSVDGFGVDFFSFDKNPIIEEPDIPRFQIGNQFSGWRINFDPIE